MTRTRLVPKSPEAPEANPPAPPHAPRTGPSRVEDARSRARTIVDDDPDEIGDDAIGEIVEDE